MSRRTEHEDIQAALAATTPGPWQVYESMQADTFIYGPRGILRDDIIAGPTYNRENAHLIANAPTWLAELLAEVDEAQAEAMYVGHDYDRRGERLWRLAALAGWTPGNEADNDATAELYVRERLAEVDGLTARTEAAEQAVQRVRTMAIGWMRLSLQAIDPDVREWTGAAGRPSPLLCHECRLRGGTSYYLTERRLGAHLAAHRNAGHDIPEGIKP